MDEKYSMLIDGKLVQARSGATMEIVNPADGKVFAVAPKGSPAEVEKAVDAAWNAQPGWASMYAGERGKFLFKLAELIRKHYEELWRLETMQYGGPRLKTSHFDIPTAADMLEWMAGIGRGLSGLTLPVGSSARAMTVREPLGVLGLITPWNFPLVTAIAKVSPALITGNTAVLKPPSCAPLTVLRLAEFVVEAGFPPGVLNIVTGPGSFGGRSPCISSKSCQDQFHRRFEHGKTDHEPRSSSSETGRLRAGRKECIHRPRRCRPRRCGRRRDLGLFLQLGPELRVVQQVVHPGIHLRPVRREIRCGSEKTSPWAIRSSPKR